MSLPLEFHPAVRDEIDDAHNWYEQRRSGLGKVVGCAKPPPTLQNERTSQLRLCGSCFIFFSTLL